MIAITGAAVKVLTADFSKVQFVPRALPEAAKVLYEGRCFLREDIDALTQNYMIEEVKTAGGAARLRSPAYII